MAPPIRSHDAPCIESWRPSYNQVINQVMQDALRIKSWHPLNHVLTPSKSSCPLYHASHGALYSSHDALYSSHDAPKSSHDAPSINAIIDDAHWIMYWRPLNQVVPFIMQVMTPCKSSHDAPKSSHDAPSIKSWRSLNHMMTSPNCNYPL